VVGAQRVHRDENDRRGRVCETLDGQALTTKPPGDKEKKKVSRRQKFASMWFGLFAFQFFLVSLCLGGNHSDEIAWFSILI
jgi:hypothetical protein